MAENWNLLFKKNLNRESLRNKNPKLKSTAAVDYREFFNSLSEEKKQRLRDGLEIDAQITQVSAGEERQDVMTMVPLLLLTGTLRHRSRLDPQGSHFIINWKKVLQQVGRDFFYLGVEAHVSYRVEADALQIKVEQPVTEFAVDLNQENQPWVFLVNRLQTRRDESRKFLYIPQLDLTTFLDSFPNAELRENFKAGQPIHPQTVTAKPGDEAVLCQMTARPSTIAEVELLGFDFDYSKLLDKNGGIFGRGLTVQLYYRWAGSQLQMAVIGLGEDLPK